MPCRRRASQVASATVRARTSGSIGKSPVACRLHRLYRRLQASAWCIGSARISPSKRTADYRREVNGPLIQMDESEWMECCIASEHSTVYGDGSEVVGRCHRMTG